MCQLHCPETCCVCKLNESIKRLLFAVEWIITRIPELAKTEEKPEKQKMAVPPALINKKVKDLDLSVRAANAMLNAGIEYLGELASKTEKDLLKTKNFGITSLREVREILSEHGLTFGMESQRLYPKPGGDD